MLIPFHIFISNLLEMPRKRNVLPVQGKLIQLQPLIKQTGEPMPKLCVLLLGGHGTRVAGAVLYPRDIPDSSTYKQRFWLQNAQVLNEDNKMPEKLFPPRVLQEIIEHFHKGSAHTKVFNHSINATSPCRLVHMSAWAASIDQLTWESDLLFIVSAGNISKYGDVSKPGIREYIVRVIGESKG